MLLSFLALLLFFLHQLSAPGLQFLQCRLEPLLQLVHLGNGLWTQALFRRLLLLLQVGKMLFHLLLQCR